MNLLVLNFAGSRAVWDSNWCTTTGLALECRVAELRTLELFLQVEDDIRESLPHLLDGCINLVSLNLHFSSDLGGIGTHHVSACVLPMLEDLEFCDNYAIITTWDLPKLKRLTWDTAIVTFGLSSELQLLAKHGRRLTYIHLFGHKEVHDGNITEILTLCPVLEHLVIPWYRTERDTAIFASVKLSYLDLWVVWRDDDPAHAMALHKSLFAPARHFAQIENVRILDRYSLSWSRSTFPPRLPLICHPALVEEGETMHYLLSGYMPVTQTSWGTMRECHLAYASDEDDEWADDVESLSSESSLNFEDHISSFEIDLLGPRVGPRVP